jgi:hypothetical protein
VTFLNNLIRDFTDAFVDPDRGDLHLADAAIEAVDKGAPLAEIKKDFDGDQRRARPDIGADELNN